MGTRHRCWAVAALVVLGGCGSGSGDDEAAFTDCALGELTGTWRWEYVETDGNCGPIADETLVLDPSAGVPSECTVEVATVSADKCRADTSTTCPTTDDLGTQSWTTVLRHVGPGRLSGTGAVQLNHPTAGNCRGTYEITVTQL